METTSPLGAEPNIPLTLSHRQAARVNVRTRIDALSCGNFPFFLARAVLSLLSRQVSSSFHTFYYSVSFDKMP